MKMVHVALDEYENKKLLTAGQREWIIDNDHLLQDWLDENFANEIDWYRFYTAITFGRDEIMSYLFYQYFFTKETLNERERLDFMIKRMATTQGFISVVIGERGTGKTTIAYIIAKKLHDKHKHRIWWFGTPAVLPDFIEGSTIDFNKIPEGVTVILDEASVQFFSRDAQSGEQINVIKKLPLIRQQNKNFIVITQSASIIDINFLRQSTSLLFTSHFFLKMSRERLIFDERMNYFMPKTKGEALYYDNGLILNVNFKKPSWFKEEFSTPYKKFRTTIEKYRYIFAVLKDVDDPRLVLEYLSYRGEPFTYEEAEYFRLLLREFKEKIYSMPDMQLKKIVEEGMDDTPLNDII